MHKQSPWMMILETDPNRYIRTPAAALIVVLKAIEGFVTAIWAVHLASTLLVLFTETGSVMGIDLLKDFLPAGFSAHQLSHQLPGGRIMGSALLTCLILIFLCFSVEAVAGILLFFTETSATVFQITRKALLITCAILATLLTFTCIWSSWLQITNKAQTHILIETMIAMLVLILFLSLQMSYHAGIITVMIVVNYELKHRFKETSLEETRIGRSSFLLGMVYLITAVAAGMTIGWKTRTIVFLSAMCVKYFAVNKLWALFQRLHK